MIFLEMYCGGETFLKESFSHFFATFLEKGSAKNFHTGKFLSHIVRSTIESTMFALYLTDNFLLRFFLKKRMGLGAKPHFFTRFLFVSFFFCACGVKRKSGLWS